VDGRIKILVLDRGHVLIGRIERHPDLAFHWRVSPSRIIRRWGTTQGLAELTDGPLTDTRLDAIGSEAIPFRAVLRILDVSESKWIQHLEPSNSVSGRKPTNSER
jgi:hypothetical protein